VLGETLQLPSAAVQPRLTLRRALGAVLLLALVALSACGGSDNDKSAQDLLNTAFKHQVKSADLLLDAQLKLSGGSVPSGPIRVQAKGPYIVNKGKLPSVNLDLNFGAGSGGQAVSTGFLSTGDRAFVKFQDAYYEQPASKVAETNKTLAERQKQRGSLKALGLDPQSWLKNAKDEGEEDVAGVKTTHVAGQLDVKKLLSDFNELVKKSGGALGATGTTPPKPLSQSDLDQVAQVVRDPNFDVYVGKDDNVVHRVAGRLQFDVPESSQSRFGGLQGGSLQFSIELSKVNGNQKIEAPANARPLSDLTKSLGAGALGGLAGGGGGTATPNTQTAPPSGGSSGGAGTPSADAFKRYKKCLDGANSGDRQALQRCANELQK
jgi:hypothetical protein